MTVRPARWRSTPFAVLSDSQYRLLFLGTTLAQLAFGMMNVVQGVVAFHLTGKNSAVGFVSLGQGLAMLLLGPVGGTLSDRLSKRRLLLVAQGCIGIMFAVVAALIISGLVTVWLLAGATLVMGCMFAVMGPTRQAWVGDLLEGPQLASGIALQQLMMNATRIVGPLVAGALIATKGIGAGGTYVTMAAVFAVVVSVLALMDPTPPRKKAHRTSMLGDLREGVTYIWTSPQVRMLTLIFVGVVLSGFSYQTIMPGFLEHVLGHPASQLGVIYGTTATGGIVTTLVLAARRPGGDTSALMFAFGLALAGSLLLLSMAPGFGAALAIAALVGASSSGFQMLNNVSLMQSTDPYFFGRVMAVTMMAFGVNSIVAYPIGQVADHMGERMTMGLLAATCFAIVSVGFAASRIGAPQRRLDPVIERKL